MKGINLKKNAQFSFYLTALLLFFSCTTESVESENYSFEETSISNNVTVVSNQENENILEAEDYDGMSGVQNQSSTEGTDNIGWINNGDWIRFNSLDLSNAQTISARVASNTIGGNIDIRLNHPLGTLIGTLRVSNTGGWQSWETIQTELTQTEGIYDVYFIFTGDSKYLFNINWFLFYNEEVVACEDRGDYQLAVNSGNCGVTIDIEPFFNMVEENGNRIISANNIPEHEVGTFRYATLSAQDETYTITLNPQVAAELTPLQDNSGINYRFGILLNGVELDPIAAEPWPHSNLGLMDPNLNWNWNLEALNILIGLDCNHSHIQPFGQYHSHGAPILYEKIANATGNEMVLVGYAADGFPIYYKYAYEIPNNHNSKVVEMTSSYQLKTGNRPGDGITAPCSEYDGAYSADYEYIEGLGSLDAANGRSGVTPEYPEGTYYYIMTDSNNFPSIPRYFKGTPSNDFAVGNNRN